jgi:hypothetical protein
MANVSGAVQIETGMKHGLTISFQSVASEQSIDVGTLLWKYIHLRSYRAPPANTINQPGCAK